MADLHHPADVIQKARTRPASHWQAMADSFWEKAEHWASRAEPWALKNLRLYQNKWCEFDRLACCARAIEGRADAS